MTSIVGPQEPAADKEQFTKQLRRTCLI